MKQISFNETTNRAVFTDDSEEITYRIFQDGFDSLTAIDRVKKALKAGKEADGFKLSFETYGPSNAVKGKLFMDIDFKKEVLSGDMDRESTQTN